MESLVCQIAQTFLAHDMGTPETIRHAAHTNLLVFTFLQVADRELARERKREREKEREREREEDRQKETGREGSGHLSGGACRTARSHPNHVP